MTEKLEKADTKDLAMFNQDGVPLGFENFDDDIELRKLPSLRICQALSKARKGKENPDGIEEGFLYNTVSMKQCEEIEIILCYNWQSRSYFQDNKAICYSLNAKTPNAKNPPAKSCNSCPFQKDGCFKNINFAAQESTAAKATELFAIQFAKSNFADARNLLNQLRYSGTPLWFFTYKITPKYIIEENYKYYKFDIKKSRATTAEERESARKNWENMQASTIETEEHETSEHNKSKNEDVGDVPF